MIADATDLSVNFLPTKCADSESREIIEKLDYELRCRLARKMYGKHRGPWGKFKKRLLSTLPPNFPG